MARKLAVIMHATLVDGTPYGGDPAASRADASARAAASERRLPGTHA
ncbi:hypothetical protein ACVINW_003867 [Bradyrhizobium sp. USDA 4461]